MQEEPPSPAAQQEPLPPEVPPLPEAEPPFGPAPRQWDEPNRKLLATANGAVEVCETLAFPLTFLPAVGSAVAFVVEWGCLVPGALALDYVGAFHTGQASFLWQGVVALLVAKLYRGVVRFGGAAVAIVSVIGYGTVVTTALLVAGLPFFIPVGLTGVLTLAGVILLTSNVVERVGSNLLFLGLYHLLSGRIDTPEQAEEARERVWYKPPLDPLARGYALMTAAAGARPAGHWKHAIPILGPVLRAPDRAEAVERAMVQVGRDVLGERPQHPEMLTFTAGSFANVEAGLAAYSHAAFAVGGALFVGGTVVAALATQDGADPLHYGAWAIDLGTVGAVVAATGILAVLLQPVPRLGMNLFVPLSFGLIPPAAQEEE